MGKVFFNRVVAPRFLGQDGDLAAADKAEAEDLPPLLYYLESVVPASGHLVDDRLTLADLAVASPFVNFGHVGVTVNGSIPASHSTPDTHPKVAAFDDHPRPSSFAPAWSPQEKAFFALLAQAGTSICALDPGPFRRDEGSFAPQPRPHYTGAQGAFDALSPKSAPSLAMIRLPRATECRRDEPRAVLYGDVAARILVCGQSGAGNGECMKGACSFDDPSG